MNNLSDFYDKLDLKYSEIAIAMEEIDRLNPTSIKFIIPILTSNMDNTKLISKTIYQNKSNLRNNSNIKLEIENIVLTNYIELSIPIEITGGLTMNESTPRSIRYIDKGSKWLVVFVGGDVTKPKVISRYLDN